jgi:hypothetical protein
VTRDTYTKKTTIKSVVVLNEYGEFVTIPVGVGNCVITEKQWRVSLDFDNPFKPPYDMTSELED